jgi:hypothetical protein
VNLDEANSKLCRHRDAALTVYGRQLLAAGASVDDEEFREKMLKYGGELEVWRMSALEEIASAIGAMTAPHSSARH